ncbi:MAG TPA: universal stress protein [Chloroflexota bacterium]|nr:universal stress protein [Chloroflexota bacterium]
MSTKILVPLDGSGLSERAVPYATVLAKASHGALTLVRVIADPAQEAETRGELAAVAEKVAKAGVNVDWRVVVGYPAEMIIAAAADDHTMIVMSTHGRSGLGRWLYGSVADEVLRGATVPVLLIPATCGRIWRQDHPFRILAPLDGSDFAEEVLTLTVSLADQLSAELLLVKVVEPPHYAYTDTFPYPMNDVKSELGIADHYLSEIARALGKPGRVVQTRSVVGHPPSAIAALATEEQFDLIAMATHGRGGVRRLVLGSVALGTLQRSTVPLLLVRPEAMRLTTLNSGVLLGLTEED